jgi:hypothetical protein
VTNTGSFGSVSAVDGSISTINANSVNSSSVYAKLGGFIATNGAGYQVFNGTTSPFIVNGSGNLTAASVTSGGTGAFGALRSSGNVDLSGTLTGATGSFVSLTTSGGLSVGGTLTGPTGSFASLTTSGTVTVGGVLTGPTGSFSGLRVSGNAAVAGTLTGATGSFAALTTSGTTTANGQVTAYGGVLVNSTTSNAGFALYYNGYNGGGTGYPFLVDGYGNTYTQNLSVMGGMTGTTGAFSGDVRINNGTSLSTTLGYMQPKLTNAYNRNNLMIVPDAVMANF